MSNENRNPYAQAGQFQSMTELYRQLAESRLRAMRFQENRADATEKRLERADALLVELFHYQNRLPTDCVHRLSSYLFEQQKRSAQQQAQPTEEQARLQQLAGMAQQIAAPESLAQRAVAQIVELLEELSQSTAQLALAVKMREGALDAQARAEKQFFAERQNHERTVARLSELQTDLAQCQRDLAARDAELSQLRPSAAPQADILRRGNIGNEYR